MVLAVASLVMLAVQPSAASAPGRTYTVSVREFIYDSAPFPAAHASTIVETPAGLVVAWFGGTEEKHPDVGIWVARREGRSWTRPVEVATGVQPDGSRHPCWNPVLFQVPDGPLVLFYKVGPSPREWWGLARVSPDGGRTWSDARRLPEGILGPIRAKPVTMPDGSVLAGSSTEHAGWVVHMERLRRPTGGASWLDWMARADAWETSAPLNAAAAFGAIQPTILIHSPTRLQVLCRSRQRVITEAWSEDGGRTWSPMRATSLPNPSAGVDAVRLADGRFLLVYNPTTDHRRTLAIAESRDGVAWTRVLTIEDSPGEYSYPAMIATRDGRVHLTYTWKRERIRHVEIATSP